MFVKAIKKIEKTMFPIFRMEQTSANQFNVNVVGTGFFIDTKGTFVTVAHVFDNTTPQTIYNFCGYLPTTVQNPFLPIIEIVRDDNNDLFVGRVNLSTPNHVMFSNSLPAIGKSICISGYPLATLSTNNLGGLELGGVRRYFQPSFVLDYATFNMLNANITRTHHGFLIRDFGLFGMSGGPVFDKRGIVLGIQGSVTAPRTSSNGSRTITVENALAVSSDLILDLLNRNNLIQRGLKIFISDILQYIKSKI